jgi:hypothetical protein
MDNVTLRECFGPQTEKFIPVVNEVVKSSLNFEYSFLKNGEYGSYIENGASISDINRIYWEETLDRVHLASIAYIRRNYGWMKSVAMIKAAGELTGYAAALRSLIEASVDSAYSIVPAINTFAREYKNISAAIRGQACEKIHASPKMEDLLINFTHGRKTQNKENAPDSHKAKQSFEYINMLRDDVGMVGIKELNEFLNGIVHPAANSVFFQISHSDLGDYEIYKFTETAEINTIQIIEQEHDVIIKALPSICLEPALIAIRALHKIKRYPTVRSLRKLEFQQEFFWSKIQSHIGL